MVDPRSFTPTFRQPSRLPDQVADYLAGEIGRGRYQRGDKLPPENALSEQFGVSRTVIREALSKLKYDGLLESRQGSGATVAGPDKAHAFRLQKSADLSARELSQLYELRAMLESNAAYLAAARRSERDLKKLATLVKAMDKAIQKGIDGTVPDAKFHQSIAVAAANPYLQDLMRILTDKLRAQIKRARSHSRQKDKLPRIVQREHEAIYHAIAASDPHEARRAVLTHLQNAAERLGLSIFAAVRTPPPAAGEDQA